MLSDYKSQTNDKISKGGVGKIVKEESNSKMPAYPDTMYMKEESKPVMESEEGGSRNYIHELTMQTMVNRDVLRKIKERKEASKTQSLQSSSEMSLKQLQEMVRELWDVTQNKEFALDMNSVYPFELQKAFDQFVHHSRDFLEKHPHFMNSPQSPTSHSTTERGGKKRGENEKGEKRREEDTKQIEVLPVFMEKQHPLWNYNYFNRKNAIHAYPVNSQYHIPTSTKPPSRSSPHSIAPIGHEEYEVSMRLENVEEEWEDWDYLDMMEKR